MSVNWKFIGYYDPKTKSADTCVRPTVVCSGVYGFRDLARDIAHRTSLTEADALAAVTSFAACLEKAVLDGKSVELEGIGHFAVQINASSVSLSGAGAKTSELAPLLRRVRIVFRSDRKMVRRVKENVTFRKVK